MAVKEKKLYIQILGFPIYESVINYSGSKAIPIKLDISNNFKIDFNKLESSITENTSLIIINFPSNPTGGVILKEMDKLVSILEKYPYIKILSDEIYSRILYDNTEFISLLEYPQLQDRVIILDGWSKTYAMTGWRIGYGVWPKEYCKNC